jgi:putative copper export protein
MGSKLYEALLFVLLGAVLMALVGALQDIRELDRQREDENRVMQAWMATTKAECAKAGIELPDLPSFEE